MRNWETWWEQTTLGDLDVDGRNTLKLILKKSDIMTLTELISFRIRTVAGLLGTWYFCSAIILLISIEGAVVVMKSSPVITFILLVTRL